MRRDPTASNPIPLHSELLSAAQQLSWPNYQSCHSNCLQSPNQLPSVRLLVGPNNFSSNGLFSCPNSPSGEKEGDLLRLCALTSVGAPGVRFSDYFYGSISLQTHKSPNLRAKFLCLAFTPQTMSRRQQRMFVRRLRSCLDKTAVTLTASS